MREVYLSFVTGMTRRRCGGDFTAHARERERGAARGGDLTGSCGGVAVYVMGSRRIIQTS